MDIEILPAIIRFLFRQIISAFFGYQREESGAGQQRAGDAVPFKNTLSLKGILKKIAVVIPVIIVEIIGLRLSFFNPEIQKKQGLVRQLAGIEKAECSVILYGQKITLLYRFFILVSQIWEYYNQVKREIQ